MRRNKLALYVHFVWATWDRLPLITPQLERRLLRYIEGVARKLGCTVLAINAVPDHVHVLLSMPSTVTIADLAKNMKGASSRFVNEELHPSAQFKWQGSYGAFTVSRWDTEKIIGYVNRQKEHHAVSELWPELEEMFVEVNEDESAEDSVD